jgi:pimeloyl-ACP methyl ester carboxylesterase
MNGVANRDHRDPEEFGMAEISERENRQIEAANTSRNTPVVFIHGLWLLPSSWDSWGQLFSEAGYAPLKMGHSTGGLLAQMLAGRGLSAATVAIDPGVFRGVLPLPLSVLKGIGPFLINPRTRRGAIRSRSTSSGTAGRMRWTRRRQRSSTTPSTSPAPEFLSFRWATPTSTRGWRGR